MDYKDEITLGNILTIGTAILSVAFVAYQFFRNKREHVKEKALVYSRAFYEIDAILKAHYSNPDIGNLLNEQFDDIVSLWPTDRYLFITRLNRIDLELLDQCYLNYKNLLLMQVVFREYRFGIIREKANEIQRNLTRIALDVPVGNDTINKDTLPDSYKNRRDAFLKINFYEDYTFASNLHQKRYEYTLNQYQPLKGTDALTNMNTIASRKWWWRQRTTNWGKN